MKFYTNKEYIFKTENSYIRPDFICLDRKKIIEFDGSCWHSSSRTNISRSTLRDSEIIKKGFEVLHIDEIDFKTNKNMVIEKCLNFLR